MRLVHRDVKPANVMVCERGGVYDVAKLLDFGLVRGGGAGTPTRCRRAPDSSARPATWRPSRRRASDALDAAADIYAVGATAYLLLTGEPAIAPGHAVQMLIAQATEPLAPPRSRRPEVPADLDAVVMRCLERNPADRFASAEALDRRPGRLCRRRSVAPRGRRGLVAGASDSTRASHRRQPRCRCPR